ncbi:ABC transporter permease [Kytococcus sp. Marseille-QA3725]
MSMSFSPTYLRIDTVRILRNVSNLVFTIGLPVFMYLIFSASQEDTGFPLPGGDVDALIAVNLATYGACTACTSIGALTAWEKQQGWTRQVLLTPLSPLGFALQKVVTALVVAAAPMVLVLSIAAATGAEAFLGTWLRAGLVGWLGSSLFALFGLLMALLIRSDASIGIATGSLVVFAFLGNIFMPLSGWLLDLARFTPMFGVVNAANRPITDGWLDPTTSVPAWQVYANMAAWFVILGAACALMMRRSSGRQ